MANEIAGSVVAKRNPKAGESLPGYLVRIAEANGYPSSAWIYKAVGVEPWSNSLLSGRETLNKMSELLAQDPERLDELSFRPIGSSNASEVLFPPHHRIPRYEVQINSAKVCPICLEKYGYEQAIWRLWGIQFCPEHSVSLISNCGTCGKEIRQLRGTVRPCQCIARRPGRQCTDEVLDLTRIIANSALDKDLFTIRGKFPEEFLKLSLRDKLKVISFLGMSKKQPHRINLKLKGRKSRGGYEQLFQYAAEALTNWPMGYLKHLEYFFLTNPPNANEYLLRHSKDDFYSFLVDPRHETAFSFLLKALSEHLPKYLPNFVITGRGCSKIHEGQQYISRYQARIDMAVSRKEMERAIAHGDLDVREYTTSYGTSLWISKASISEYVEKRKGLITIPEVSRRLGVSIHYVSKMISEEAIKPVFGPRQDQSFRTLIDPKDVDEILSIFVKKKVVRRLFCSREIISLQSAARLLKPYCGLLELMQLVRDDHLNLAPRIGRRPGLENVRLYKPEIRCLQGVIGKSLCFVDGDWVNDKDYVPPSKRI